jgi:hypothetical protein
VQDLEKGERSYWKRLALILGVLGGLIAIPKGIQEAWTTLRPSPDIRLIWADDVTLSYDPQTKNLNLIYGLSISNTGTAEDHITSASIELNMSQPTPFYVGSSFIHFEPPNQQKLTIPVTIGKGETKDVRVYVVVNPGMTNYALENPGARETNLSFTLQSRGVYNPVSRRFCLHEIDSEALKTIVSGQPWHPTNTSCQKG